MTSYLFNFFRGGLSWEEKKYCIEQMPVRMDGRDDHVVVAKININLKLVTHQEQGGEGAYPEQLFATG